RDWSSDVCSSDLKDETQDGRIPLAIPRSTDGRNLLAEVDGAELGPAVGDIHQVALRDGVLAGLEDKVVLEAVHALDAGIVAVRNEDSDVVQGVDLADRVVAQLGVHAVLVLDDQPVLLATDAGVVDGVLNLLLARQDAGAVRAVALLLGLQVEVPELAGDVGGGGDQQEALGAGGANAGPEALIFLAVEQVILLEGGAESVALD